MNEYQEALIRIEKACCYLDGPISARKMLNEDLNLLMSLAIKADSFEWIPVSDRLPEQSLNSVLGWDAYRERCCFVQYYNNEWILGNHETVKIIAWAPLPEPYKGEIK